MVQLLLVEKNILANTAEQVLVFLIVAMILATYLDHTEISHSLLLFLSILLHSANFVYPLTLIKVHGITCVIFKQEKVKPYEYIYTY